MEEFTKECGLTIKFKVLELSKALSSIRDSGSKASGKAKAFSEFRTQPIKDIFFQENLMVKVSSKTTF